MGIRCDDMFDLIFKRNIFFCCVTDIVCQGRVIFSNDATIDPLS